MTLRSMFSAVAGLRNHQTRIDVIGNNISNVNTVGFKAGRVTFQDIFSQTLQGATASLGNRGGTNPIQVGLGAQIASIDTLFTQGNFESTGRTLDLAIEGEGFFQLASTTEQTGEKYYTRAGNFNIDSRGYLVYPSNGFFVQGLTANENGEIDQTQPPSAVQIDFGAVSPAIVTRNLTFGGNLNANSEPEAALGLTNMRALFSQDGDAGNFRIGDTIEFSGGDIGGATALTGLDILTISEDTTLQDLADAVQDRLRDPNGDGSTADGDPEASVIINDNGTFRIIAGTQDLNTLSFQVVDGAGATLTAQTAVLQSVLSDAGGAITQTAGTQFESANYFRQADVTTSIDVFDSQGNARTVTIAFAKDSTQNNVFNWQAVVPHVDGNATNGSFPVNDTGTLTFTSNGLLESPLTAGPLVFDPDGSGDQNGGVDPLQITLDFSALTQFAAESTAAIETQDGSPQGALDSIAIDRRGIIRGLFTNGATQELAQVLLASIPNQEGMVKIGDSMFQTTANTGTPVLGEATERGRGAISSGTLELSNVDLASEFTDLIITQRGFQANARVITTGDEILNELVNII